MLFENTEIDRENVVSRWKAGRRALAVIACAAVVAGCSSMPTLSEMGDGISETYTKVETGVRNTYNETFNSSEQASEDSAVAGRAVDQPNEDIVPLSRSGVKRLQGRLAKLAYRPGPVDGVMGSKTIRAIKKYQADHGLRISGRVSSEFLAHLEKSAAIGTADPVLTNSPYN